MSRLFETNQELSSLLADDKPDVEALHKRLDQAVNQFSAIRFIEEVKISTSDDVSDEDDDFVEVPPLPDGGELPSTSNASGPRPNPSEVLDEEGDKILSGPVMLLTDKLPWEMEGHPTSSNSKYLQPSAIARSRRSQGSTTTAR